MANMRTQELNEEYLSNLLDRWGFENEIRALVCGYDPEIGEDPWLRPMYLIPMWNIFEKIKSFEQYFKEFDMIFPSGDIYRQPINFSTAFPSHMIHTKEEEFIFKGEKIKVAYNYVI